MLSYHNDQKVKDGFINRMKAHMAADTLTQGVSWHTIDGKQKGCAIGCTLNNYNPEAYPDELGFPIWLAKLEDSLFESTSKNYSDNFPLRLLQDVPVGVSKTEFNRVEAKYLLFILEENLGNIKKLKIDSETKELVIEATKECITIQQDVILTGHPPGERNRCAAFTHMLEASEQMKIKRGNEPQVENATNAVSWTSLNTVSDSISRSARATEETVTYTIKEEKRQDNFIRHAEKLLELLRHATPQH